MVDAVTTPLAPQSATPNSGPNTERKPLRSDPSGSSLADRFTLSPEEQRIVAELAARDREVRAHENAHKLVGGPYAGKPSYQYEYGPDETPYAVGGEVPIDVSPVSGDPEATVAKMRIVEAAALAPPEPSATDRAVAALARSRMLKAQMELSEAEHMARDAFSVRI